MTEKKSESSFANIKSKIKVVFLGDQSTGKTSILLRFIQDRFEQGQAPTVGIDFMAKNLIVNSTNLRLQLWDTAGQQRFRSLIPSYLKDATVTFIVFDLANHRSFENIKDWIELCKQNKKQGSITILVGNKSDLKQQRQVTNQQAQKYANNQQMSYFEVSAKNNSNIKQIFNYAAQQYVNLAFGNQETIGNIQHIHKNLANKMIEKQKEREKDHIPAVSLSQQVNNMKKQSKKKTGCC